MWSEGFVIKDWPCHSGGKRKYLSVVLTPKEERPWNEFRDAFRKAHLSHLTIEGGFPTHTRSTRAPKSASQ